MAIPRIIKLIHDQYWALLEARPEFARMVVQGNRIKLDDEHTPFKKTFGDGDFPQVVIIPRMLIDGRPVGQQIRTFGMIAGTCTARLSDFNVDMLLGISHLNFGLTDVESLILEVLAALREAQFPLNTAIQAAASYARVKTYGPLRCDHDHTGKLEPIPPVTEHAGTPRPTTVIPIPMTLAVSGQASEIFV